MIGNKLNRSDPSHLGLTAKQRALVSGGQEAKTQVKLRTDSVFFSW